MTNRGKSSTNRQTNNNNNKSQNDDDNCSVICYKDSNDGHVGVVRIRQQPICSACNLLRGTLSAYFKHIVDNTHRENVKKLCDENRFVPSVYDQAIHLAFQNNFYYQSEKFHFLYKYTNEEADSSSSQQIELKEINKMDIQNTNQQQKTTPRKRRNLQVTLIFQEKTYSQIGIANAQIREQLLKDMLTDRAADLAGLPMEIYYTKKKIAPEDIHHNAQKGSVIITTIKDQLQVMLKEQQQEPFENGQMSSSAENSREDNGVEQNTAMTTHEISTAEKLDHNEQSSFIDDDDSICKTVLNHILRDVYSKSDEFKREQRFLSGLARRSFRKKNTFFCDLCNKFLTSEKNCSLHLNSSEHLEKVHHYATKLFPWRQAMQKALFLGKSLKEIMDKTTYENYKATMAFYLAPNSLCNRGRFCCAYCEVIFSDQWSLEKHLHSVEHKEKQTPVDHKDLVVRFANGVNFPIIFKFNGITQLSEIPDDIKTRYQWRHISRSQLDDDINAFNRTYPFDTFEGVTRILSGRAARKQKSVGQNSRNNNQQQHARRNGFSQARGGQFQTPAARRGTVNKRPFPATAPPSKRFRADLNNIFPGTNRGPGSMRNYNTEQYNYNQPGFYNNGNNHWPSRYPNEQQPRQEFFERSNFELRSLASDNNGYYNNRSTYPMFRGNNYNQNRQAHFSGGGRGYDNQQSNYDPNFIHGGGQGMNDYHPEQNPSSLLGLPNRPHPRANTGPINELMQPIPNNFPHPQNQNSFGGFGVNNHNSNTNSPFFPSPVNQQPNPMNRNSPSIRSYGDYRTSSVLPNTNSSSSMYPPLANSQNSVIPQARTFDEFGLAPLAHNSSNSYTGPGGSSFRNEEPHYHNVRPQNQIQSTPQPLWRGSTRGGNNNIRGRGRASAAGSFQSNKQPGATFSYSSSNNNNNKNNTFSTRGRGAGRNFGSGR